LLATSKIQKAIPQITSERKTNSPDPHE
jgi:hypothetical protein